MDKMNIRRAIVRKPCPAVVDGITMHPELGKPDFELATKQHGAYVEALIERGVEVIELPALFDYPDSCFVEDPVVVTPYCAIMTNSGAKQRRGERDEIIGTIKGFFDEEHIYHIQEGTLDGGDVMHVEDGFFVGISARTNEAGFEEFKNIVENHGMWARKVPVSKVLHLITGATYLGDNRMLVSGPFRGLEVFKEYETFEVPDEEAYGANCINVNGKVFVAKGYPTVLKQIENWGYEPIILDTSEFRKIDGSLTCLSVRF